MLCPPPPLLLFVASLFFSGGGDWVVRSYICHTDVQNFDVATTEATAKEFMNVGLGFDETQYGQ